MTSVVERPDLIHRAAFRPADAPPRAVQLIRDDEHAVAAARELAATFARDAAERDARRRLPHRELAQLTESGLLGITVPRGEGGPYVRRQTVAEVYRLLATADPSIAQIPLSHVLHLDAVRRVGTAEQRAFLFGEVLAGRRIAGAEAEADARHAVDLRTRLLPQIGGGYLVDGVKQYATGALFADWLAVAAKSPEDRLVTAFVPVNAPGVTVTDDWDGLGQRTSASGTVRLDGVWLPAEHVLPGPRAGAAAGSPTDLALLLRAAIEVGIARGGLTEAAEFVRTRSRAWFESGRERAQDDPLTVQRFGELEVSVRAAEALLAEAGRVLDSARASSADRAASVAVASAKAFADRVAIEVTNALFEVSGTRSALRSHHLDRHWRNARTHTVADPVRWRIQHIGRHVLDGPPPL
jgi:SfnB family sulfur acquisition oxidoreductase